MRKKISKLLFGFLLLSLLLVSGGCGGGGGEAAAPENGNPTPPPAADPEEPSTGTQAIRVTIDGHAFDATLNNTSAARAFAAVLPLEMDMRDHLRREKVARLPGSIPTADAPAKPFEAGDITYWAPGQDLAIFYTSRGSSTVSGLYVLGTLSGGFANLNNGGASVRVRIEAVN